MKQMSWQATSHWVAPKLTGGIGNRLFQALAAFGIAERTGRQPVWLLAKYCNGTSHGESSVERELCPDVSVLPVVASWNETANESVEDGAKGNGLVVRGYFQRIDGVWPSIHCKWLPRLPVAGLSSSVTNAVAVHFRFGDYCSLPKHQVDLRGYYKHAISLYDTDTVFWLFSDTPEKLNPIAQELQSWGLTVVIKTPFSAVETWKEMSNCAKGMICSNSTFAWWGAYFAGQRHGASYIAYMPNRWLQTSESQPKLWDSTRVPFAVSLPVDGYASGLEAFLY